MTNPRVTAEQVLWVLSGGENPPLAELWFAVITHGTGHALFEPGEMLVLNNEYGREPFGEGRKPSKWDVTVFYTQDFESAKALAALIKSKSKLKPGYYAWDGRTWSRPDGQDDARERYFDSLDGEHDWAEVGQ